MKRIISNLNKSHLQGIRRWLRAPCKDEHCPFKYTFEPGPTRFHSYHCHHCKELFPGLPDIDRLPHCPCSHYPLSYVIKVARWVLKERGIMEEL